MSEDSGKRKLSQVNGRVTCESYGNHEKVGQQILFKLYWEKWFFIVSHFSEPERVEEFWKTKGWGDFLSTSVFQAQVKFNIDTI